MTRRPTALAAVLLLAPAALAQPDTVPAILAHVREAVGSSHIADHSTGVNVTGHATIAGVAANYSFIFDQFGHYAGRFDGRISLASGFDGARAWTEDLGSERRILDLGDREGAILGGLIITDRWLAPDAPITLSLSPAREPDAEPEDQPAPAATISLGFQLTGGEISGRVEIDRSTWLPKSWSWFGAGQSFKMEFDGTIDSRGLRFPAHIDRTGTSGLSTHIDIEKVSDAPLFFRSPYEPVLSPPTDVRFDPGTPAALKVKKAPSGHLLVHPLVNGKDLGWFIFDTGAGSNLLSTAAAETLCVETFGQVPAVGIGGTTMTTFCRPDSLSLGPVTIDKPLMVVLDLTFLNAAMGRPIGGIIGYPMLHRTVAQIDMETPTIALHEPAAFDGTNLHWRRLIVDGRVPCVEASFEDHTGYFRLDTGAGADTVSFYIPAVERLKLLENRQTTPTFEGGVGGMIVSRRGQLAWFEIGGHRTENVAATFSLRPKPRKDADGREPAGPHGAPGGAFATPYALGNIGGGLVRPFTLVMDYQHGHIAYIERAPSEPRP